MLYYLVLACIQLGAGLLLGTGASQGKPLEPTVMEILEEGMI